MAARLSSCCLSIHNLPALFQRNHYPLSKTTCSGIRASLSWEHRDNSYSGRAKERRIERILSIEKYIRQYSIRSEKVFVAKTTGNNSPIAILCLLLLIFIESTRTQRRPQRYFMLRQPLDNHRRDTLILTIVRVGILNIFI